MKETKAQKRGRDTIDKLHNAMAVLEHIKRNASVEFADEDGIKQVLGALENAQRYIDRIIDLTEHRHARRMRQK